MSLAVVYQLKNKDSDVFKVGIIPGEGSLYWDHILGEISDDSTVVQENCENLFQEAPEFSDRQLAYTEAEKLRQENKIQAPVKLVAFGLSRI
jgi:hypothetical protein